MTSNPSSYNYLDEYLQQVLSKGRYSVTLEELLRKFDSSEKAILQNIFRLKKKGRLAQVRSEFYVIVPPRYAKRRMVPPMLFIDDMMEFLKRPYYIGLLSAAALHGAGHQQPMELQVVTGKPAMRMIRNKKLAIRFFTRTNWSKEHIVQKKTETGYLHASCAELTAFDLLRYQSKIGGLGRIYPIIQDLAEEFKVSKLSSVARSQSIPNVQRLGFLLERLGYSDLSARMYKQLAGKRIKAVDLSPAASASGPIEKKWKVHVNVELES